MPNDNITASDWTAEDHHSRYIHIHKEIVIDERHTVEVRGNVNGGSPGGYGWHVEIYAHPGGPRSLLAMASSEGVFPETCASEGIAIEQASAALTHLLVVARITLGLPEQPA